MRRIFVSVRLDPALSSALDRYCAEAGVTKSLVVQQSLAAYLLASPLEAARNGETDPKRTQPASANFRAFEKSGLIGAVTLDGGTADKARVRARIAESFIQRRAHQGGA